MNLFQSIKAHHNAFRILLIIFLALNSIGFTCLSFAKLIRFESIFPLILDTVAVILFIFTQLFGIAAVIRSNLGGIRLALYGTAGLAGGSFGWALNISPLFWVYFFVNIIGMVAIFVYFFYLKEESSNEKTNENV